MSLSLRVFLSRCVQISSEVSVALNNNQFSVSFFNYLMCITHKPYHRYLTQWLMSNLSSNTVKLFWDNPLILWHERGLCVERDFESLCFKAEETCQRSYKFPLSVNAAPLLRFGGFIPEGQWDEQWASQVLNRWATLF